MNTKLTVLVSSIFLLLVAGMFIFAYLVSGSNQSNDQGINIAVY